MSMYSIPVVDVRVSPGNWNAPSQGVFHEDSVNLSWCLACDFEYVCQRLQLAGNAAHACECKCIPRGLAAEVDLEERVIVLQMRSAQDHVPTPAVFIHELPFAPCTLRARCARAGACCKLRVLVSVTYCTDGFSVSSCGSMGCLHKDMESLHMTCRPELLSQLGLRDDQRYPIIQVFSFDCAFPNNLVHCACVP